MRVNATDGPQFVGAFTRAETLENPDRSIWVNPAQTHHMEQFDHPNRVGIWQIGQSRRRVQSLFEQIQSDYG